MTETGNLYENRRRASSFGDDAERYDRVRPPYPVELVDFLMEGRPRTVLDVGCGTGIVARLFMARGCDVLGLEPDPRMADVARRNGVNVEAGMIEEWRPMGRRFDLLTAGQAWHWVHPDRGTAKAAEVLRPTGRIGLFWNQANPHPSVRPVLEEVYARHAPEIGEHSVLMGQRDASLYQSAAESLRRTKEFDEVTVKLFGHDIIYSASEWVELAASHSDHHTLPDEQLTALLSDMRLRVDETGGHVPVHYEVTLVTGIRR